MVAKRGDMVTMRESKPQGGQPAYVHMLTNYLLIYYINVRSYCDTYCTWLREVDKFRGKSTRTEQHMGTCYWVARGCVN